MPDASSLLTLGWREWVALPDLGLAALHAKLDTGADTSVVQAVVMERFERDGLPWLRFTVHPLPDADEVAILCTAPLVGERGVMASTGHLEHRPVIRTTLQLGLRIDAPSWPIELTLTDRRALRHRLLLGRSALAGRALVDPAAADTLRVVPDGRVFYGC